LKGPWIESGDIYFLSAILILFNYLTISTVKNTYEPAILFGHVFVRKRNFLKISLKELDSHPPLPWQR
ncbi:MAG: hypothetical protein ACK559_41590, partial [bacterium]